MTGRTRRQFLQGSLALASLGLVAGCGLLTRMAPSTRMTRVGFLTISPPSSLARPVENFKQGMTDLGYVEGQHYTVEARYAENNLERLPDLAAELVGLPVDVLVADGGSVAQPLKAATGTIPIVMVGSTNPVEAGLVASLARPGGNVTGLTTLGDELDRKRLELLKETVPGLARVGVLWNPFIDGEREFQMVVEAARTLGLEVYSLEARDQGALEAAFERAAADRVDGLFLLDNSLLTAHAPRIAELARRHRLPTISRLRLQVAAGGLLAYGADRAAMHRRAAGYVDRILKGANPAEMPIERPTTFEFVINLRTARDLGLTIPPSVLQQATEVIQ